MPCSISSSRLAVPVVVLFICTLCYCVLCLVCSVFVGVIEQLFDEDVLIGSGWTARETIRCVCVCVCVDLVRRCRYVRRCTIEQCSFLAKEIQRFQEISSHPLASPQSPSLQYIFLLFYISFNSSRSLAYSILADLVHHVRAQLTLTHLSLAVELFSRNIHDDCLPTSIQIMSCKVRTWHHCRWFPAQCTCASVEILLSSILLHQPLYMQCRLHVCECVCVPPPPWLTWLQLLLNLVDNIRQKSEQEPKARDVMIHMMDCFIEKFNTIAEFHLPDIFCKW